MRDSVAVPVYAGPTGVPAAVSGVRVRLRALSVDRETVTMFPLASRVTGTLGGSEAFTLTGPATTFCVTVAAEFGGETYRGSFPGLYVAVMTCDPTVANVMVKNAPAVPNGVPAAPATRFAVPSVCWVVTSKNVTLPVGTTTPMGMNCGCTCAWRFTCVRFCIAFPGRLLGKTFAVTDVEVSALFTVNASVPPLGENVGPRPPVPMTSPLYIAERLWGPGERVPSDERDTVICARFEAAPSDTLPSNTPLSKNCTRLFGLGLPVAGPWPLIKFGFATVACRVTGCP